MSDKKGAIPRRKGTKYVFSELEPDKKIVSMIKWEDFIYVATQKGVYGVEKDNTLVRLRIIDKTNEE